MRGLTAKQEAFARAYLKTGNASGAYRQAYDAQGMSSTTIEKEARRLLANPRVRPRIEELTAPVAKAAAEATASIIEAATMDATETIGQVVLVAKEVPEGKISFTDKLRALEMLMKHHGAYERDNKQKAPNLSIHVAFE